MRQVVIGDIHGCLEEFQELVDMSVHPGDEVICLGDFLDKGPDPLGCLRFAIQNNFRSVLANHESRHLQWRKNEERAKSDPKYSNGMRPFSSTEEESVNTQLTDSELKWIESLPPWVHLNHNFLAVHGGLMPFVDLEEQTTSTLIRARFVNPSTGRPVSSEYGEGTMVIPPNSAYWMEVYDGPHNVVYGHEAHSLTEIRIDQRPHGVSCYGIDTGCVHGGRLTALILQEDGSLRVNQVQSKRVYERPLVMVSAATPQ